MDYGNNINDHDDNTNNSSKDFVTTESFVGFG